MFSLGFVVDLACAKPQAVTEIQFVPRDLEVTQSTSIGRSRDGAWWVVDEDGVGRLRPDGTLQRWPNRLRGPMVVLPAGKTDVWVLTAESDLRVAPDGTTLAAPVVPQTRALGSLADGSMWMIGVEASVRYRGEDLAPLALHSVHERLATVASDLLIAVSDGQTRVVEPDGSTRVFGGAPGQVKVLFTMGGRAWAARAWGLWRCRCPDLHGGSPSRSRTCRGSLTA